MKFSAQQLRQMLQALDTAGQTYRRARQGLEIYSPEERARREREATANWRRTILSAHDAAREAETEAQEEIARIDRLPDLREPLEASVGGSQVTQAAVRAQFIREDVEVLPLDTLVPRLERAIAARDDAIGHALWYRYASRRLAALSTADAAGIERDAEGHVTGVDGASGLPGVRKFAESVTKLRALLVSPTDARARQEATEALEAAGDVIARAGALLFELDRFQGQPILTGR